jgi:16S rRNA A1518/A1519 N6-dimethyltransferase RsmA/KsgA/DIM1 with predicted DNA glycosylase/AP lyase activity
MNDISVINKKVKTTKKNNNLGQFFTTDETLQKKVYDFILNKPSLILEPSIGAGDLINFVLSKSSIKFDMYEIDTSINFLHTINKKNIIFGDFLTFYLCDQIYYVFLIDKQIKFNFYSIFCIHVSTTLLEYFNSFNFSNTNCLCVFIS